jgi:WD40 repeat protein
MTPDEDDEAAGRQAEAAFGAVAAADRAAAREILLRLDRLWTGVAVVRTALPLAELVDPDRPEPGLRALHALLAAGLVTEDDRTGDIGIVPAARSAAWPRLRLWAEEAALTRRHLAGYARIWDRGGRRDDDLPSAPPAPSVDADDPLVREYLAAGRERAHREQERARWRARRRRGAVVGVCVLALAAGATGVVRGWSGPGPDSAGGASGALATAAGVARPSDPGLAAQLAVAAYRAAPTDAAAAELYRSLDTPLDRVLNANGKSAVLRVAVQPGGPLAAASDQDGSLRIWNLRDPAAPVLDATIPAGGAAVAIAPDGRLLAARCGQGDGLCLWNLANPGRPAVLARLPVSASRPAGQRLQAVSMAISRDGDTLAVAAEDGATLLWSIARPDQPRSLGELPDPSPDAPILAAVAFSPRADLLAQTIEGGRTELWQVGGAAGPVRLATIGTGYQALAFSPDGHLLSAVGDTEAGLWNVDDPAHPAPIPFDNGTVGEDLHAVTFSADSHRLGYAGADAKDSNGVLCLLDVTPSAAVSDADCTPTGFGTDDLTGAPGGALLSGGFDGAVRLWRSPLPRIPGVIAVDDHSWDISPDSRLTAVPIARPDNGPSTSVGIWDLTGPGDPGLDATVPVPDPSTVRFLTGTTLLTVDQDGAVRLWNLADPHRPARAAGLGTAKLSTPDWPLAVAVDADTAGDLVSVQDPAGVHLWRVGGAGAATEIGTIHPGAPVTGFGGLLPDGRTAFLLGRSDTTWYDVSDPAHPVRRGQTAGAGTQAAAIALAGNVLALGTAQGSAYQDQNLTLTALAGGRPAATPVPDAVGSQFDLTDDTHLLAASTAGDNGLVLWDTSDPARPRRLTGLPTGRGVAGIEFDRAGNRLADWNGGSIDLWDLHRPAAPARISTITPPGAHPTIDTARFAPSGGLLAVLAGGAATLVDTSPAELATRLCADTGNTITPAQWSRYAPTTPYTAPCP